MSVPIEVAFRKQSLTAFTANPVNMTRKQAAVVAAQLHLTNVFRAHAESKEEIFKDMVSLCAWFETCCKDLLLSKPGHYCYSLASCNTS